MTTNTSTGKPNRTGAATRSKIIDAAIAVLAEKGFAGFTLQAVADRTGVFYGNVTHHYPTRDKLIAAMLDTILERYRARFDELAASLDADGGESPMRTLVTWLLDDAVSPETAPLFLELWAMASHIPEVAAGLAELYDGAVGTCMTSLGVSAQSEEGKRLRYSLFLLGTVLEGSSSIFYNRGDDGTYAGFRREAAEMLVPHLELRLAQARRKI